MYLDFYKLKQLPFRLTADPRFHYKDAARTDAADTLVAALDGSAPAECDGCVLVSGDDGVGKTILVHDVLGRLAARFMVVQIRQPEISVAEFREAIAAGLEDTASSGSEAGPNLDACLARQAALGRCVVISVDNGEMLAEPLLDEIVHLPRRGVSACSPRVILAARSPAKNILGQPRFARRVNPPGMHVKIAPLAADATRDYIEHRLRIAGRTAGVIFHDDALTEIQRFTGGVPRLINMLADAALMAGYNRNHDSISAVEVRGAANQLQWVEFDARPDRGAAAAAAADEERVGHVRIEHDDAVIADFELPLGKISLGRSANNDVRIDSRFVSRHHCQIVTTTQYSVIEDLQSENGLSIGTRHVSVHRLQHGDRVHIGLHTLTYTRPRRCEPAKLYVFPLNLPSVPDTSDTSRTGQMPAAGRSDDGAQPADNLP